MRKIFLFIVLLISTAAVFGQQNKKSETDKIVAVLMSQKDAWNKGDMEAYMEGYWKSDSLKFIGKNGITYGWQRTLDNYKKSYPDKSAMGKLEFTVIKVEVLSSKSAFMIGKWKLIREKDTPQGHFTLLWKKINNKWKVVADHSS